MCPVYYPMFAPDGVHTALIQNKWYVENKSTTGRGYEEGPTFHLVCMQSRPTPGTARNNPIFLKRDRLGNVDLLSDFLLEHIA